MALLLNFSFLKLVLLCINYLNQHYNQLQKALDEHILHLD